MSQENVLIQAAITAMKAKHGNVSHWGRNNQYFIRLPNGTDAHVKTGSKGQIMQRTKSEELDAEYIGAEDAALVVIAVQNGPTHPIRVYEVPGQTYRDRMTQEYADRCTVEKLKKTDLRVLRFNDKGYPFQRVDKEWAKYEVKFSANQNNISLSIAPEENSSRTRVEVVEQAKVMVAEAFGVPPDRVNISVSL